MKRSIKLLFLSLGLSQLVSATQIYEGFNLEAEVNGERLGFMTSWHRLAGDVGISDEGLSLPGLINSKGALSLTRRGEALAQIEADVSGTYYGSFRVRSNTWNNDSIIGLLFARPDLDELTPRTANISILIKRYRDGEGAILSGGRAAQSAGGVPMLINETYLVVFKVQEGSGNRRLIESWVLNADQVEHFVKGDFTEAELNAASLGANAGEVMQRTQLQPQQSTRLALRRGDVVACIAKLNPSTIFDEIRVSSKSLRDAAGAL